MEDPPLERRARHPERRLEEADITNARPAAVSLDLVSMEGQNLVQREERNSHALASRAKTPPYCRWARSTTRLSLAARFRVRTGEITITSPSVDTSRGVLALIPARSRSGRSSTSARLLPVLVSFLTMEFFSVRTVWHGRSYGSKTGGPRLARPARAQARGSVIDSAPSR